MRQAKYYDAFKGHLKRRKISSLNLPSQIKTY